MGAYAGIGKLGQAVKAGVKAYQAVNHGTVVNPKIPNPTSSSSGVFRGSWGRIPFNVNVFVWDIHKWGSKTNRVGQ